MKIGQVVDRRDDAYSLGALIARLKVNWAGDKPLVDLVAGVEKHFVAAEKRCQGQLFLVVCCLSPGRLDERLGWNLSLTPFSADTILRQYRTGPPAVSPEQRSGRARDGGYVDNIRLDTGGPSCRAAQSGGDAIFTGGFEQ